MRLVTPSSPQWAAILEEIDRRSGEAPPLSTRGDLEYTALVDAIEQTTPDCLDDARFTTDEWPMEERGELALICSACPLALHCLAYAREARPDAGFWAGQTWTTKKREKKS